MSSGAPPPPPRTGYVQVYTGEGKGKTTAALGLALRASGHGLRTYIGQFLKGQPTGELLALRDHPLIRIEQYGAPTFLRREEIPPEDVARAREGLALARDAVRSGAYDIVVLDEVNLAIWFGLLEVADVLDLLDERPPGVELVLTGRRAPEALVERADLVTEMREVKHYHARGVHEREGIER